MVRDADAPIFDEDEYGFTISHAFAELRLRRPLIPLENAERLARANRPNVPWQGIGMISAHGNREALQLLLKLYDEFSDLVRTRHDRECSGSFIRKAEYSNRKGR
jgi:hypothetical protein